MEHGAEPDLTHPRAPSNQRRKHPAGVLRVWSSPCVLSLSVVIGENGCNSIVSVLFCPSHAGPGHVLTNTNSLLKAANHGDGPNVGQLRPVVTRVGNKSHVSFPDSVPNHGRPCIARSFSSALNRKC